MYRLSIFGGDTEEFGFDSLVLYPIFCNLYDVLLIICNPFIWNLPNIAVTI